MEQGLLNDISELYDFELIPQEWFGLDTVLDSSEYYDFDLGENVTDYIYVEIFNTYRILTEDQEFLITEDGFKLRY
jgi:hypothetical protein